MLTENRKRQRSGGDEDSGQMVPQAKRQGRGHPLSPEPGRDAWDSESSNSESSFSSPEYAAGNCASQCVVGPCSPHDVEAATRLRPSSSGLCGQ
ncbi:protein VCF1 isoform X2 [Brachionichthys hirsutus]|uniref:protein VCF1 isoform X2 n=1 Tax=Brachionichthys hirsutus TaxID=412623 RepID=UPI0036049B93